MILDLGKHIADLLREHNRVSLPGVGAFVGSYKPAMLNEETLALSPPYTEINFSKDETWNDELLENYIARVEELSIEEAKRLVTESVAEIVAELHKNGNYAFHGLGQLVKDGWRITFEMEIGINLLPDAFGLETISMQRPAIHSEKRGIDIENPAVTSTNPQPTQPIETKAPLTQKPTIDSKPKSKNGWVFLGLLAAIAILAGYLYFDGFFGTKKLVIQKNVTTISNILPSDTSITESYTDTLDVDTTEQKIVATKIDSQTEKRKALYYEEPKNATNGVKTFYIIAGSFNKMENAEKLKQIMIKQGYKPEILTEEGPIFRVSMYSFTNRNRALQELARLRSQDKDRNVWLLGL